MKRTNSKIDNREPILVEVVSLGCAKNLVDAEVMCGFIASDGFILTDDRKEATVSIINTCGFIQSARDEAAQAIRKALDWKARAAKKGRRCYVVVTGCWAQRAADEIASRFPQVDALFGIDEVPNIATLLNQLIAGKADTVMRQVSSKDPKYLYDERTPRLLATPPTYAFVKIAEGCNHRCAFCAIPDIRGKLRSRTPESILAECRQLLADNINELVLIAQDTTAYGRDLPEKPTLAELLTQIDQLPGKFWVRVLYTHPVHITPEFLKILASGKHIVPYLDVPLQHIADGVLRGMRRAITSKQTSQLISDIRKNYPDIVIRTTLLVGFPGETDADFQMLKDFVKEAQFERMGAFTFSPEEGTPAAAITEGMVPAKAAQRRYKELLELQREISFAKADQLIGKKMTVLLEYPLGDDYWEARSAADAPEVDPKVIVKCKPGKQYYYGDFIRVQITSRNEYDLIAKALDAK